MTTQEFSNSFDTLLNSYSQQAAFGNQAAMNDLVLDEYEKSVFLTEAEKSVVLSYYAGDSTHLDTFEKTEEIRRYLNVLVETKVIKDKVSEKTGLSSKSTFFSLPADLMFITYEQIVLSSDNKCLNGKTVVVVPVEQDDYWYMSQNPFKGVNESRAFRLDVATDTVEIIAKDSIAEYLVRYIRKPKPIILTNLGDLSIEGESNVTECELPEVLHQEILNTAVRLAVSSKTLFNGK